MLRELFANPHRQALAGKLLLTLSLRPHPKYAHFQLKHAN
jgi:hypothetical protein